MNGKAVATMQNDILRTLARFLADAAAAIGTPSGDTRGHLRVYARENEISRGRDF